MKKIDFKGLASTAMKNADKNAPQLLFGMGIALGVMTVFQAFKSARAADKAIEQEIVERNYALRKEAEISGSTCMSQVTCLTKMDTVKVTWKCYAPVAVLGTLSLACLITGNHINAKRTALLTAAYKLSEETYRDYKKAVIDTVGDKKESQIRDKYLDERMERYPLSKANVFHTGKGDTLCFDSLSGIYFYSSIEAVKNALADGTAILQKDDALSVGELFEFYGIPSGDLANNTGWSTRDVYKLRYDLTSKLTDMDEPALVIDYLDSPRDDYNRRW